MRRFLARLPRPRFRMASLLVLVAVVALGLGAWRAYHDPKRVWLRAVHGEDQAAESAAWQQAQEGLIAGLGPAETEILLIDSLKDRREMIRFRAVAAVDFSRREPGRAIPLLVPRLADDSPGIRLMAAAAIGGKVDSDGAGRDLAEPALLRAIDDPVADVRGVLVDELSQLVMKSGRPGDPLIRVLSDRLKDENVHVRIQAAAGLARAGGGDEARPLLEAYLVEHPDLELDGMQGASVVRALFALSRIATRSDEATAFLLARVYRRSRVGPHPVLSAIQETAQLSEPGRRRVVALATKALGGTDLDIKAGAATVLDSLEEDRATVPAWVELLGRHDDPKVRLSAVSALQGRRPTDPACLPALRKAAEDTDPRVRKSASEGVGRLTTLPPVPAGAP